MEFHNADLDDIIYTASEVHSSQYHFKSFWVMEVNGNAGVALRSSIRTILAIFE